MNFADMLRMPERRTWVTTLLGLTVSGLAMALAFRQFDAAALRAQLAHVKPLWVAAALSLTVANVFIKGLRWQQIMAPVASLRLRDAASILAIGYAGNNILPARLGEAVRMWLLERNHGVALGSTLGTIVVERLLDVLIVLTALTTAVFTLPVPPLMRRSVGVLYLLVASAAFVLTILALYGSHWSDRLRRLSPRLGGILESLTQGLHILRARGRLGLVVLLSGLIWFTEIVQTWIFLRMFELPATLSWSAYLTGITTLGSMVPAGPGYVGTYELMVQQTLLTLGVEAATGLGVALTMHFIGYVAGTVLGLACFFRELQRKPLERPPAPAQ